MTNERPHIGVVGVPGGWSSESLVNAVKELTGYRTLIDMDSCVADLGRGRVTHGDIDLSRLDGIIIKKVGATYGRDMLDRLELLRYLAERGVPVFSKPASILRLLNRLSCTITLARGGIPIPPTTITENLSHAAAAVRTYGAAVLKPLYSTKAKGMELVASTDAALLDRLSAFQKAGNPVLYVQKRLEIPDRDLGVVFLGGAHVGTYARVKKPGSWNTTTRDGGRYEAHEASDAVIALAHRAQALFDLDLTSVDVVETDAGPMVFEVSAFGGFSGSQEGLKLDLARRYASYVVERVRT